MPGIIEGPFRFITWVPDADPWKFKNHSIGFQTVYRFRAVGHVIRKPYRGPYWGELFPNRNFPPDVQEGQRQGSEQYSGNDGGHYKSTWNGEVVSQIQNVPQSETPWRFTSLYGQTAGANISVVPGVSAASLQSIVTVAGGGSAGFTARQIIRAELSVSPGASLQILQVLADGIDVTERVLSAGHTFRGSSVYLIYLAPTVPYTTAVQVTFRYLSPETTPPFSPAIIPGVPMAPGGVGLMPDTLYKHIFVERAPTFGGTYVPFSQVDEDNMGAFDSNFALWESYAPLAASAIQGARVENYAAAPGLSTPEYRCRGLLGVTAVKTEGPSSGELVRQFTYSSSSEDSNGLWTEKQHTQVSARNAVLVYLLLPVSVANPTLALSVAMLGQAFDPSVGPTLGPGWRIVAADGQYTEPFGPASPNQETLVTTGASTLSSTVPRFPGSVVPALPAGISLTRAGGSANRWTLSVSSPYGTNWSTRVERAGPVMSVYISVALSSSPSVFEEYLLLEADMRDMATHFSFQHLSTVVRYDIDYAGTDLLPTGGQNEFCFFASANRA